MRVDIVFPCRCHGLRNLWRIHICKNLLNASKLRNGVDLARTQGVDELISVVLAVVSTMLYGSEEHQAESGRYTVLFTPEMQVNTWLV